MPQREHPEAQQVHPATLPHVPGSMTPEPDPQPVDPSPANGTARPEPTRPITIMLPDSVLKKLKVVAILKETTVSDLLADAAVAVVRRELKRALGKIATE